MRSLRKRGKGLFKVLVVGGAMLVGAAACDSDDGATVQQPVDTAAETMMDSTPSDTPSTPDTPTTADEGQPPEDLAEAPDPGAVTDVAADTTPGTDVAADTTPGTDACAEPCPPECWQEPCACADGGCCWLVPHPCCV